MDDFYKPLMENHKMQNNNLDDRLGNSNGKIRRIRLWWETWEVGVLKVGGAMDDLYKPHLENQMMENNMDDKPDNSGGKKCVY